MNADVLRDRFDLADITSDVVAQIGFRQDRDRHGAALEGNARIPRDTVETVIVVQRRDDKGVVDIGHHILHHARFRLIGTVQETLSLTDRQDGRVADRIIQKRHVVADDRKLFCGRFIEASLKFCGQILPLITDLEAVLLYF